VQGEKADVIIGTVHSGVAMAMDLVGRFRTSSCDGVHLVSGNRYRDVAQALLLSAADAVD